MKSSRAINSTHTKEFFQNNKYVYIPNVIPEEIVKAVSAYCLVNEAYRFQKDTGQVENSHAVYADPLMECLLLEYKNIVEEATGLSLHPSYSFYRVYRRGQELEPHIDRPACEISISVCYEYNYMGEDYEWPLYMEQTPIAMKPGDMAIYRGCEVNHWRPVFAAPEDSYQVQSFYHYVDQNGPYSKYAYDANNGQVGGGSHLKMLEKVRAGKYE